VKYTSVPCPYCQAAVGDWCTVEGSTRLADLHEARDHVRVGYWAGLIQAEAALTQLLTHLMEASPGE
jgi:hypothetical protein